MTIWCLYNSLQEGEVNRPLSFTDGWPYAEYVASACLNVFANLFMIVCGQYESNPALIALLVYCKCIYTFLSDKLIFHATFVPL